MIEMLASSSMQSKSSRKLALPTNYSDVARLEQRSKFEEPP